MSAWAPRRFWKEAGVAPADGGFAVHLDGRPVRTPAKAPLVLPTPALAAAVAAEWDAQEGLVRPETMPCTRTANSAIDKLALQQDAVIAMLADYGAADLLCYRAAEPAELAARQAASWDPLLAWAAETLGAPLAVTTGIIHIGQPPESLARLRHEVAALSRFELAAFHDLVAISGSLVLALAVVRGHLAAEDAFERSRIDENWQAEQWGHDAEAAEAEAVKRADYLQAARFFGLCR